MPPCGTAHNQHPHGRLRSPDRHTNNRRFCQIQERGPDRPTSDLAALNGPLASAALRAEVRIAGNAVASRTTRRNGRSIPEPGARPRPRVFHFFPPIGGELALLRSIPTQGIGGSSG
jgi:hypothetical protein